MIGTLESRLAAVRERLAQAERAAGRSPGSVRILPVTKSAPPETALALAGLAFQDFGENRLEGLTAKTRAFVEHDVQARWHFIGQIQRNKLRKIVELADVLHSVDRLRLVDALARVATELGRRPEVYLQVRFDEDPTRAGFEPGEVPAAVAHCRELDAFDLRGLMTLAPRPTGTAEADASSTRRAFEGLARIASEITADDDLRAAFLDGHVDLSMGMSADLEQAVLAGSHVVRIGTALVGPRDPDLGTDLDADSSRGGRA